MKTKDLIALLQSADPSGELHVCLQDNRDVFDVHRLPAYMDGRQEILVRDENNPFFNVLGGILNASGDKIAISGMRIEDAMIENPDMPVIISGGDTAGDYRRAVDKWRTDALDIIQQLGPNPYLS